jgi:hypothetical protein
VSNKKFILHITDDQTLRKQIRGCEPLRAKQIHKDRREKREGNRRWQESQDW